MERHVGYNLNGLGVYVVLGEDGCLSYWMDGAFLAVDSEAERWFGLVMCIMHASYIVCMHR